MKYWLLWLIVALSLYFAGSFWWFKNWDDRAQFGSWLNGAALLLVALTVFLQTRELHETSEANRQQIRHMVLAARIQAYSMLATIPQELRRNFPPPRRAMPKTVWDEELEALVDKIRVSLRELD